MGIGVVGYTHAVLRVDGAADLGRNANPRSYPGCVEMEIRTGICNPGARHLVELERSGRPRINGPAKGMGSPSRLIAP
jgi:hypothetical protein